MDISSINVGVLGNLMRLYGVYCALEEFLKRMICLMPFSDMRSNSSIKLGIMLQSLDVFKSVNNKDDIRSFGKVHCPGKRYTVTSSMTVLLNLQEH